jgi:hypothetical protein
MQLKNIRNRINKKIDSNYKTRQKILSRIKDVLTIDFNKIAVYREEINIKYPDSNTTSTKIENGKKDDIMFKVEIPDSLIGKARYYYKGTEIDYLSIEEANNLEKDLKYILEEIEKNTNEIIR